MAGPCLEECGAIAVLVRVESPAAVVGDKLFLFGGFTDDLGASNELDVYDPASDTWTRRKDMPTHVTHLNTAIDGNIIWFAGGFKGKHPGPVTDEVWKYDIAADAWSAGPPLPEPRGGGGLAIVDHKLHYFGGFKADRNTDAGDHWSLSLEDGKSWQREADLPHPRGHVTAAVLDGNMYCARRHAWPRHHADRFELLRPIRSGHEKMERDRQPSRWSKPFRIKHDHPQRPDIDRRRKMQ